MAGVIEASYIIGRLVVVDQSRLHTPQQGKRLGVIGLLPFQHTTITDTSGAVSVDEAIAEDRPCAPRRDSTASRSACAAPLSSAQRPSQGGTLRNRSRARESRIARLGALGSIAEDPRVVSGLVGVSLRGVSCAAGVRHGDRSGDIQAVADTAEVGRVAGVDGQVVRNRRGGDHRVVCAGGRLATGAPVRRGHAPEGAGGVGVEGERVEISLGLLELRLARHALVLVVRDERADREARRASSL